MIRDLPNKMLVVDLTFMPLDVVNYRKAVKLLYLEKAEILTDKVLQIHKVVKMRFPKLRYSHHLIFIRDNNTCQYCGKPLGRSNRTIDHVHPQSLGGESSFSNCVASCRRCNNKKGNNTKVFSLPTIPKTPTKEEVLRRTYPELMNGYDEFLKLCS